MTCVLSVADCFELMSQSFQTHRHVGKKKGSIWAPYNDSKLVVKVDAILRKVTIPWATTNISR